MKKVERIEQLEKMVSKLYGIVSELLTVQHAERRLKEISTDSREYKETSKFIEELSGYLDQENSELLRGMFDGKN